MSKTKTLIRNIYLYLATFVGLMMIAIPAGQLLKLSLQNWFFPLAIEQEYRYEEAIPTKPYINRINENTDLATIKLTQEEVAILSNWQSDYKTWQERQNKVDWRAARMQQNIVDNLSIMLVGLVIFLAHGYVLKKDKKTDK